MSKTQDVLIETQQVRKDYRVVKGYVRQKTRVIEAVKGISFIVGKGETVGLVGESGCGKTTTAKLILRLETPTAGTVLYRGKDILQLSKSELKQYRSSVQAVFQDPWSSLSPRMRIGSIIAEPLIVSGLYSHAEVRERVAQLLAQVGLRPEHSGLYPHEFSGGQRQRIAVARALSIQPELIVLDEPVSSLDVSIRAQVMNLLNDIQSQYKLSYLLIAHDLATVRYLCNRVMVMYLGRIVEEADAEELFNHPSHPYLKSLLAAALPSRPDPQKEQPILPGEISSTMSKPRGCRYSPRCPYVFETCFEKDPEAREVSPGHKVFCHLF